MSKPKKKTAVPSPAPAKKKPVKKNIRPAPTTKEMALKLAKNSLYGKMDNPPAVPSHSHPHDLLPEHPQVGDGRIWDGSKWIAIAPTHLAEIVAFQNTAICRQNEALKVAAVEMQEAATNLMLAVQKIQAILDGR